MDVAYRQTHKSSSAWHVAEVYKRQYAIDSGLASMASNDKQIIGGELKEIRLWNLEKTDACCRHKKETILLPESLTDKKYISQLCMPPTCRCIIAAYSSDNYFWNLTNPIRTSCYLDSIYEVQLANLNCQWSLQDDCSIHIWICPRDKQ